MAYRYTLSQDVAMLLEAAGSSGLSGMIGHTLGTSGSSGVDGNFYGSSGVNGSSGYSGDAYSTTSNQSMAIPTSHPTSTGFTVSTNLSYTVGQTIVVANDATHLFTATVNNYNFSTGAMTVVTVSNVGTGTFNKWGVNVQGVQGASGSSGTSGLSGTSGSSGKSGTSGITGTAGTSGLSYGTSGTSGNGTAGTAGTSGRNGTAGSSGVSISVNNIIDYADYNILLHSGSTYSEVKSVNSGFTFHTNYIVNSMEINNLNVNKKGIYGSDQINLCHPDLTNYLGLMRNDTTGTITSTGELDILTGKLNISSSTDDITITTDNIYINAESTDGTIRLSPIVNGGSGAFNIFITSGNTTNGLMNAPSDSYPDQYISMNAYNKEIHIIPSDDASGTVHITDNIELGSHSGNTVNFNAGYNASAPSTASAGTVTNRYGGATNFLGDPVGWIKVKVWGVEHKIPYY